MYRVIIFIGTIKRQHNIDSNSSSNKLRNRNDEIHLSNPMFIKHLYNFSKQLQKVQIYISLSYSPNQKLLYLYSFQFNNHFINCLQMNQKEGKAKKIHVKPLHTQEKSKMRPIEFQYEGKDSKKVKPNEDAGSQPVTAKADTHRPATNPHKKSVSFEIQRQKSSPKALQHSKQILLFRQYSPQNIANSQQYSPIATRQIFEIIIAHIANNIPHSDRKCRLDYILIYIREEVPLQEIVKKLDSKDLTIIAQHKKMLEILDRNFYNILKKAQYSCFKDLKYRKMILAIYNTLPIDINIASVSKSFKRQAPVFLPKQGLPIIHQLLNLTKKQFQSSNIKHSEQDQLIIKTIQEKSLQINPTADPFAEFETNPDSHFDHVSKYGVFSNKVEECQLSREGFFNYRLHRTMFVLQKMGIMNPQQNIRLAKNIAIFIMKLTDIHITQIVSKSMKTALITSRSFDNNAGSYNQIQYFSRNLHSKAIKRTQNMKQPNEAKVTILKYPSHMKLYQNLRTMELIEQSNLSDSLQEDIYHNFSSNKRRITKDEKSAIEYYCKKPNAVEFVTKLKADTERQIENNPTEKQVQKIAHVSIKPRHVKSVIQKHSLYKNHYLLWRFNAVY